MISRFVEAFIHYGENHDLKTDSGLYYKSLENRYHLTRLPLDLDAASLTKRLMINEYFKRASLSFSHDFFRDCEELIAENLMSLALKHSEPLEDYDSVPPKRSHHTVASLQTPSVTVKDQSEELAPSLATINTEPTHVA
jgi:hypothetical protein